MTRTPGMAGGWLCPTDMDRSRVVDASAGVRMIRTVGSAAVGVALVAATPWLGWWTLILFAVSALNLLTVDVRMARSAHPEWVSVRAILVTLALLATGVGLSGGSKSPALMWLVLPAGMVAARFRPQVVAAGLVLTLAVIFGVTFGVDPHAALHDPVPVMFTVALLIGVVSIVAALQGAELHQRGEATVDPLTGLSNRRQLIKDLERASQEATDEQPVWLVMFDLDGFKAYNDAFGHMGGDLLLTRLARAFDAAVDPVGRAYRLGGDEFCALLWSGERQQVIDDCLVALSAEGEGFVVTSSFGVVSMPSEAADAEHALQLADERMYAFKDSRRTSAGRQTRDLALQIIAAHEPALRTHASKVAELTEEVARRLGLTGQELSDAVRAAELHDIGKVAMPYDVLRKTGPLDEHEWELMRRHAAIGANILSAAPALSRVAEIVGATHERWDGNGYPRGLRGEAIPLASRVVFVCDSFAAMITGRPFGEPQSEEDALAELHRCAGTQFDPRVVETFLTAYEVRRVLDLQTLPRTAPGATPSRRAPMRRSVVG